MKNRGCAAFLHWALPRLGMRWEGFRRVRRQVCKRVAGRVSGLALADFAAYRQRLERDPAEWDVLAGLCRVTISRFYRDAAVFDALGAEVMPALAARARARGQGALRAWSAGCGSGEEPYSLRLLWEHAWAAGSQELALEVLGTDIDPVLLERAATACYPGGCLRELPGAWREAYFHQQGDSYCLRPALRAGVEFRLQDVRREQPDGPFDLILCRNLVFTYFDDHWQRVLLAAIRERLAMGGALVIGRQESLPAGEWSLMAWAPCIWRAVSSG